MKDIHDVITHAKFGDDRLRGSGVVAGQISAFLIDFAGRPYNTLALPCERVIGILYSELYNCVNLANISAVSGIIAFLYFLPCRFFFICFVVL